jgi:hypothetical protein
VGKGGVMSGPASSSSTLPRNGSGVGATGGPPSGVNEDKSMSIGALVVALVPEVDAAAADEISPLEPDLGMTVSSPASSFKNGISPNKGLSRANAGGTPGTPDPGATVSPPVVVPMEALGSKVVVTRRTRSSARTYFPGSRCCFVGKAASSHSLWTVNGGSLVGRIWDFEIR